MDLNYNDREKEMNYSSFFIQVNPITITSKVIDGSQRVV